ncbi:MAG: ADP-glyceromanno-heptose 6-epimerase [Candidatus Margulisbacteria bacterium]|nr:ADP-glyceromanno-heptose 6-epimerase [Candidatus Margulisiibacteriota bacterium]
MIVLTGGAGFIGSCFLWKLNQQGEQEVLVVDQNDSELKMKNLNNKKFVDFVDTDAFLEDVAEDRLPKNVKAIWHIGACSSTTETNVAFLEKNNTEYSKTLCQWAINNGVPFYYASSAATYGDGSKGYSDEDSQTVKLKPLNLYGKSKHDFDLWLLENNLTSKVVGFKYFNVFGPNEYHKGDMRSLVVKAYQQIKRDGKIRLFKSYKPEYKDGEQQRDFVYVKDCIELMFNFSQNQSIKGIFNLGTGQSRTWIDLAKAIFSALGLPANIEFIEMPESIKDKYQYFTEADLDKLKSTGINYKITCLEDAVADYVKNYLEKDLAIL